MGISVEAEPKICKLFSDFRLKTDHFDKSCKAILIGRPDMHPGTKFKSPEDLFRSLGADDVDSLDISDFEGANIIHDMNLAIPNHLKKKYSLVYDSGSMEHCFDIKQFLFNANAMLKKGGLIYHRNPLNNSINHGFYSFSPCLYLGFYMKNNFKLLDVTISGFRKSIHEGSSAKYRTVFEYQIRKEALIPLVNCPRLILERAKDPSIIWNISFLARKQSDSTTSMIPLQPIYDPNLQRLMPKQEMRTIY